MEMIIYESLTHQVGNQNYETSCSISFWFQNKNPALDCFFPNGVRSFRTISRLKDFSIFEKLISKNKVLSISVDAEGIKLILLIFIEKKQKYP